MTKCEYANMKNEGEGGEGHCFRRNAPNAPNHSTRGRSAPHLPRDCGKIAPTATSGQMLIPRLRSIC